MNSSLEHRRDRRSISNFRKNLQDFTEREYFWGLALRIDFCQRGKTCQVIEHGVDNSGKLIENRLPNYNVDKIYKFLDGTTRHIEIKTIPEYCVYWTIKVSSLKSCVNEKAFVLIPKSNFYWLFDWQTCLYLIKKYEHKIIPEFSPNDLSIRIYKYEIEQLENNKKIYKYTWLENARKFIKENSNILFRRKAIK